MLYNAFFTHGDLNCAKAIFSPNFAPYTLKELDQSFV